MASKVRVYAKSQKWAALGIVDAYLKKYKISNKARWLRETVLTFIHQKMEEDYPTLFNEHDMRR